MRTVQLPCLIISAALFTLGCGDQTAPTANGLVAAADRVRNSCPTASDVVVHDEAGLLAALAAAHPREVIAVDGLVQLTSDAIVGTDSVTLTCATAGSGLYATSSAVTYLLRVFGRNVTVDRLVLQAGPTFGGAMWSNTDEISAFADDVHFTRNTVRCADVSLCIFITGGARAVVAGNYFESNGSTSGVHIQPGGIGFNVSIDGARVERNTIVAISPSGIGRFGAIRPIGASGVTLRENRIIGPWSIGISMAMLHRSDIRENRVDGASGTGIGFGEVPSLALNPYVWSRDNVLRENEVRGSGVTAFDAKWACDNRYVENETRNNAMDYVFESQSGANRVRLEEERNPLVTDNGNFDCDGDGVADPNIIGSGSGGHHESRASLFTVSPLVTSDAATRVITSVGIVVQ